MDKIEALSLQIRRSLENLGRLFSSSDEGGVCPVDPALAGAAVFGILANVTVLDKAVAAEFSMLKGESSALRRELEECRRELEECRRELGKRPEC